ncbi:MAG TPA: hypothetical protein VJS44_00655 [Pyrinomonadaceae bacterium]|nr:hypothetical protein [Pyrinomonadaceae bacterium]
MNIRRALLIAFFVIVLASLSSFAGGAEGTKATQQKAVVFAVFGGTRPLPARMEPVLLVEGGQFKEPVSGGSDAEEINRFSGDYYKLGRKYRLLFGGAEAGTATVKKSSRDEECFRTGAEVTLQTDARLNRNVMALATDSDSLGQATKERARRSPTTAERSEALELARSTFRQKGVAASLLSNIEVLNLTAVDLDRDGKFELAGSFVASKRTRKQERYALFLLAVPDGANYRAAVSNYSKYGEADIMSGAAITTINEGTYVEKLVEHLDLDGDRTSELLTITEGLEGVTYNLYKKQGGAWKMVYEFANYRCAF